jgi:hypothetical protein
MPATVQPIIAPMYAPGQRLVGAEDSQEMPADDRGPAEGYPQREVALYPQRRLPQDNTTFGNLIEATITSQDIPLQSASRFREPMPLPFVSQESQPSLTPTQAADTSNDAPRVQPPSARTGHPLGVSTGGTLPQVPISPDQIPARSASVPISLPVSPKDRASTSDAPTVGASLVDALFLQPGHSMDTLVSEEASTVLDTELPARGSTVVRPPVDSTMSSSLDLSMPEVQEREWRTTPALRAG